MSFTHLLYARLCSGRVYYTPEQWFAFADGVQGEGLIFIFLLLYLLFLLYLSVLLFICLLNQPYLLSYY